MSGLYDLLRLVPDGSNSGTTPGGRMTTITDTIAGALREHGIEGPWIDQDTDCTCGEMVHDYDTHLAEVIAAAIEPEIRKREWAAVSRARRADEHEKEQA